MMFSLAAKLASARVTGKAFVQNCMKLACFWTEHIFYLVNMYIVHCQSLIMFSNLWFFAEETTVPKRVESNWSLTHSSSNCETLVREVHFLSPDGATAQVIY